MTVERNRQIGGRSHDERMKELMEVKEASETEL